MLISPDLPINREKFLREDRVLTITGATWQDYQNFNSEEYPGYRVSYFQGEIFIVSPGLNHEIIASVIDRLILAYCDKYELLEFPFRQTRLELTGQAGREPDIAYSFQTRKSQPDLVVEVIFSSGDIDELKASYKNIGIPELWIWKKNKITFYLLNYNDYQEIRFSRLLPKIEADNFLEFINRAFTESPAVIKKDFLKVI
ncbi:Uma2 family endonuclease [Pleurocapsa sp. PCC 7319]|uniref:Uma2 family endonuclease n=1 Tax=Pleurocapsa sp. PCC 7319 TaxID=118161 RepID=UPI00034BE33E|nr:Uma2 family endonuclease [Pleurocapsa sp. PCC 7319]